MSSYKFDSTVMSFSEKKQRAVNTKGTMVPRKNMATKSTNEAYNNALKNQIDKLIHIGEIGCNMIVGNGKDTRFWKDRWMGDNALIGTYPFLHEIC